MSIARNLCHGFEVYLRNDHGNKENNLLNPDFTFEWAIEIITALSNPKATIKDKGKAAKNYL